MFALRGGVGPAAVDVNVRHTPGCYTPYAEQVVSATYVCVTCMCVPLFFLAVGGWAC